MDLASAVSKAYETKWSYVSNFRVQFVFPSDIDNLINWNSNSSNYDLFVKDFSTPQFSFSPIEIYMANTWRFHTGRNEIYRFSMTFRDYNQMELYQKLLFVFFQSQQMYFNSCAFTVKLFKDADYLGESEKTLFEFQNCMIDAISQVQFSNETEAQIAEFSVDFKTNMPLFAPSGVSL